jgi:tetratricopeptide (TPR) repeat protein
MSTRRFLGISIACVIGLSVWAAGDVLAGKPIPSGKDAYTSAKLDRDNHAYLLRTVDQYDKHTKDATEVRKLAKAFAVELLEGSTGSSGVRPPRELDKDGDKLLAADEQDPLILSSIGCLKLVVKQPVEAKRILTKAHESFASSDYPASWKFRNCKRLRSAFIDSRTPPQEWQPYKMDFVKLLIETMAEAIDEPQNRRFLWLSVEEFIRAPQNDAAFALQTAIYEEAQKAKKIDPWMKDMIDGWHHFSLGCRLRGRGTIATVTPEGMQGLKANMAKASECFKKAWAIDPKLPEPAACMCSVASLADGEDLSSRDWFDRSVEAQMDYDIAYSVFLGTLLPRWGGSHEEMYDFGRECLATQRFDTSVPEQLIQVLLKIDAETNPPGGIWRKAGVYEDVKKVLEGVENETSRRTNPKLASLDWILTEHFLIAAHARKYDDARKALDRVGDKLRREVFTIFKLRYPYDVARIRVLTGDARDEAQAFDEIIADNDYREAATTKKAHKLIEVIAKKETDAKTKPYLDFWRTSLRWQEQFDEGKWVNLTFDKSLSMWEPSRGNWNAVDEFCVSSVGQRVRGYQRLKSAVSFGAPFEVECDVDFSHPDAKELTGLAVGDMSDGLARDAGCVFLVHPTAKLIFGSRSDFLKADAIHMSNPKKCHLYLRYWNPTIEFFVDGQLHPETNWPNMPVLDTISLSYIFGRADFQNVRIRKLSYGPPPSDDQHSECLAYFEESVRRDPKDGYAYFRRGLAQKGLNNIDEAVADLNKAAELSTSWAKPTLELVEIEIGRKHWRKALEAIERCVKVIDDNPNILILAASILATAPDQQVRDGKLAIPLAKKACELSRFTAFSAFGTLAAACAESGDFDEAVKWAAKSIELAPAEKKKQCQDELDLYKSKKPLRHMPTRVYIDMVPELRPN